MHEQLNGACPNCDAQIVLYDWGFECSVCKYDHKQWAAFLTTGHPDRNLIAGMLAKFPMHIDSPALHVEAEVAEASLHG